MFQFNFDKEPDKAHQDVDSAPSPLPWELHTLTEEDQAARMCEEYNNLTREEKWERSIDQPIALAEKATQYVWHFDMINDTVRNKMYNYAIAKVIRKSKSEATKVADDCDGIHVLDIGTGSGILAILAAKHGASKVTAVEVESAVARVASINVSRNGFDDIIQVQEGHSMSSSIQVPAPVHVVVSELLDTGLLGECYIPVLRNAKARGWMRDGCRVIPSRGRVYGQIVQSDYLNNFATLNPEKSAFGFEIPRHKMRSDGKKSPLACSLRHLLRMGYAKELSVPFVAWDFDFENLPPECGRNHIVQVPLSRDGDINAVVFWWDVFLNHEEECVLSTSTSKQHQDHWLQAYTPVKPNIFQCRKEQVVNVECFHDDVTIWFEINNKNNKVENYDIVSPLSDEEQPQLQLKTEVLDYFDCRRNFLMNTSNRTSLLKSHLVSSLTRVIMPNVHHKKKSCVVILGDGPLLPLVFGDMIKHGIFNTPDNLDMQKYLRVVQMESGESFQKLTMKFLYKNEIPASIVTSSTCGPAWDLGALEVNAVCGEPYFQPDMYCKTWGKSTLIRYWMACHALMPYLSPDALLLPARAVLKAVAVECRDLRLARLPCSEEVEDLNLTAMNTLHSVAKIDSVELWQYDHRFLSTPQDALFFNFWDNPGEFSQQQSEVRIAVNCGGECHALAMWIDYSAVAAGKTEKRHDAPIDDTWCSTAPSLLGHPTPHLQGILFNQNVIPVEKGDNISCTVSMNIFANDITFSSIMQCNS